MSLWFWWPVEPVEPVEPVLTFSPVSLVAASVMVWTEIKLPFNPPPLHMTSLWCTSRREPSLVRRVFSRVTCSQSEPLAQHPPPQGSQWWNGRKGEGGKRFHEWKHGGEGTNSDAGSETLVSFCFYMFTSLSVTQVRSANLQQLFSNWRKHLLVYFVFYDKK